MKIGISGCSNSSNTYGKPWHYYVGKHFNAEIIESFSPGAGNEMNFEKIKYILESNKDLDYFILQVTEPSRFVIGLSEVKAEHYKNENYKNGKYNTKNDIIFKNSYYYTINCCDNNKNLHSLLKNDISIDNFIPYTYTSDYNMKYKVFHTLLGIQKLCDIYQKKIIFFSWFVDLHDLARESGYSDIIETMDIIPGCVEDIVNKYNIKRIPNDGHFDSISSELIYNYFLKTELEKRIK